jgi:hypothetical protein
VLLLPRRSSLFRQDSADATPKRRPTMTTTRTRLLRKGAAPADLGRHARQLAKAFDPLAELGRYERHLLGTTRARQHALEDDSAALSFALHTLLAVRMRGLSRHLRTEAIEQDALQGFLAQSLELATSAMSDVEDADSLADVVTTALDEIHSYFLAHDLVTTGYLEGERELARRLLEEPPDDNMPGNGQMVARSNAELALAA